MLSESACRDLQLSASTFWMGSSWSPPMEPVERPQFVTDSCHHNSSTSSNTPSTFSNTQTSQKRQGDPNTIFPTPKHPQDVYRSISQLGSNLNREQRTVPQKATKAIGKLTA